MTMKKIYLLTCLVFLIASFGVAKPIMKEVAEAKVKIVKQNAIQAQLANQKIAQKPLFKSVVAKSKMLDEITFPDGSKKELKYNDRGQTIGYKYYMLDEETSAVKLSADNAFIYDANGNRTQQVFNTLKNGSLTVTEKDEYEFDSQNRETLHILSAYSEELEKLVKYSKTITSYQASGFKTEDYLWDEEAQTWNLSSKSEVEVNNNRIVKGTIYAKSEETGEIVKTMVMEYSYNANGSIKQILTKMVDETSGEMVDFMKSVYSYDGNGNEISSIESMFDSENWMEWSKTISTYNSSNMLTSDEYYDLDWLSFQLAVSEKHEYNYTNNQLTQELVWQNIEMMGELSQSMKFEYTYNNAINIDDVVLPDSWIEHNDENDTQSEFIYYFGTLSNVKWYDWDYDTEAFKLYRDATYHYSNFGSGVAVNTLGISSLNIGPNPFSENISVSLSESAPSSISVYNIAGQKVFNTTVKGSKTISTTAWEKGIYMIHFTDQSGKHEIAKLVKR